MHMNDKLKYLNHFSFAAAAVNLILDVEFLSDNMLPCMHDTKTIVIKGYIIF